MARRSREPDTTATAAGAADAATGAAVAPRRAPRPARALLEVQHVLRVVRAPSAAAAAGDVVVDEDDYKHNEDAVVADAADAVIDDTSAKKTRRTAGDDERTPVKKARRGARTSPPPTAGGPVYSSDEADFGYGFCDYDDKDGKVTRSRVVFLEEAVVQLRRDSGQLVDRLDHLCGFPLYEGSDPPERVTPYTLPDLHKLIENLTTRLGAVEAENVTLRAEVSALRARLA